MPPRELSLPTIVEVVGVKRLEQISQLEQKYVAAVVVFLVPVKSVLAYKAHTAGSYPSFRSIKQLGIFLPYLQPLYGMLVHCRVTPQHYIHQQPFNTPW